MLPTPGASLHFHNLAAYNLMVFGRKRWLFTPPASAVFSLRPAHEWVAHRLPALLAANVSILECEQRPGDLLVLPDRAPL